MPAPERKLRASRAITLQEPALSVAMALGARLAAVSAGFGVGALELAAVVCIHASELSTSTDKKIEIILSMSLRSVEHSTKQKALQD